MNTRLDRLLESQRRNAELAWIHSRLGEDDQWLAQNFFQNSLTYIELIQREVSREAERWLAG